MIFPVMLMIHVTFAFPFTLEVTLELPQACMPDSVKRLLKVYEVVEQIALVL